MARLEHEVWRDAKGLPMCCLAGPDGDDARRLNGDGARLVWTFEAGSHFEAMTTYNRYLGRGEYTTVHASDHDPYPDEWLQRQRG
ncbi:MAG TPA: hypothetical protein VFQ53_19080 [Kofleriaceae bacterium]|nr:hypothetical protein [Kofleriaceae bacterium]